MIHRITKQYRTETGHRLSNYDGKCSHLHGHSYLWEVTLSSNVLDKRGMAMDFGDLKGAMKKLLDPVDHCMVLCEQDPLVQSGMDLGNVLRATNGKEPRLWITPWNPTAENFAAWLAHALPAQLHMHPDQRIERIKVWETATSFAEWNNVR